MGSNHFPVQPRLPDTPTRSSSVNFGHARCRNGKKACSKGTFPAGDNKDKNRKSSCEVTNWRTWNFVVLAAMYVRTYIDPTSCHSPE